jgi:SAM-dependent methyltransferase
VHAAGTPSLVTSLRFHHHLFFRELGALLPEGLPLSEIHQVLDVFCGPGSWSIELAGMHPDIEIVGVDRNKDLMRVAQQDAGLARSSPPLFVHCPNMEQLPYASERFDLIHSYHSSMLALAHISPTILRELWRVLRPGGWINLVHLEIGFVSSLAADTLFGYLDLLYRKRDNSSSANRTSDGSLREALALSSAVFYPQHLAQLGCHNVSYQLHPIDLGNQKGHKGRDFAMSLQANGRQITDVLASRGIARKEEVQDLFQAMVKDALLVDYFCVGMLVSIVGVKPILSAS